MDTLLARIAINPLVRHGKPVIRNTRYTAESILEYLADSDSPEDILQEFPDLEREDILACMVYASVSLKLKGIEVCAA